MSIALSEEINHVYFLGIGGISMSGLAEILKYKGYVVSGSDIRRSGTSDHLEEKGIQVNIGHSAKNITDDIDLLVYTAAVKSDNPEMIAAKEKNIKIIDRAALLGAVMKSFKNSIAISGTHGKTTTSSMVSEILLSAQTDPTISIGGILPSINGNIRIGSSEYFVAEACEYFDSFLKFNPFLAVILNVEADHLDYFKDLHHIQTSFKHFAERVPDGGTVIINSFIENKDYITSDLKANVISYGVNDKSADYYTENIIHNADGSNSFDVYYKGKFLDTVYLNVPGDHNISNALAAYAVSKTLGIASSHILDSLKKFNGADRRFQYKGTHNGVTVIDDYAHHPTEIKATLAAAKNMKQNKIWSVFQPHTFSRTKIFLNEFSEAFDDCDNIIIADIYAAREKDTGEINAKDLVNKLCLKGKNAQYLGGFDEITKYLETHCSHGDLLITMGAGDVYLVGEKLLSI